MLWLYATAGLTGILCGCFFRVPALIFLSFLSFSSVVLFAVVAKWSIAHFLVTAVLFPATLQIGYLVGAGLGYFWQQPHAEDCREASCDYESSLRGASQQSVPNG